MKEMAALERGESKRDRRDQQPSKGDKDSFSTRSRVFPLSVTV